MSTRSLVARAAYVFEIELARVVAEHAGFRPHVVVVPYDDLLSGLARGDHDLVAATTGITPEREQLYLFTVPYFETCQAALVRAGENEPETLADLAGLQVGASGEGTSARAAAGLPGSEAIALPKGEASVPFLERGEIDALIVDEFVAVETARASNGRLRVIAEPVALERYAFVLPLSRADLKVSLDSAIATLELEGRVEQLRTKFGVARDERWPVNCAADPGDAHQRARSMGASRARSYGGARRMGRHETEVAGRAARLPRFLFFNAWASVGYARSRSQSSKLRRTSY